MNTTSSFLESRSPLFLLTLSFLLVVVIGTIDAFTGFEIALASFYLIPISLASWYLGRSAGLLICFTCAIALYVADLHTVFPYTHPAIIYWNTAIRLTSFLIISILLAALRVALQHEKDLARIDNLTGAFNRRYFCELLTFETNRCQRNKSPITLAYIDLDNFKYVNDRFGHAIGDKVLSTVVAQAKFELRMIDYMARMGGDEFVIFLSDTDKKEAQVVMDRIQLRLLDSMRHHHWPITFSIGVLTCENPPDAIDELVVQADKLMYVAKKAGKNSIHYSTFEDHQDHELELCASS